MSFKNFKQYLEERKDNPHGIISDNKGFANRDYDGDLSLKPRPQSHPTEYYASNANKNPGLMTADGSDRGKPLGDLASTGMTPKNSAPLGQKPVDKTKKCGGKKKKKLPTKKAMKVEHFLEKTSKMSDVQFTKYLLEDVKKVPTPEVRDLYGRKYVPEPAQTMKYVAHLMLTNENMMRRMVRELKRNNGLNLLIAEVLSQPETYDCLNEAARGGFGKMIEQKISMFFEGVSPPRASGGSPGPASAGAPGGGGAPQGGAFGGGGLGAPQGAPQSGISSGPSAGGFNMNPGGDQAGMMGMGEDEMMGGMGGGGMDDAGGDIHPEDDEHHHDDDEHPDDMDDMDDGDESDDDDDENDDEDLADDEDNEDEDDDDDEEHHDDEEHDDDDHHHGAGDMSMGMGSPPGGMGGMGGMGM
jgi:hypothetical protein